MSALKVLFTYPGDINRSWEKELPNGQIPRAGDLVIGPRSTHDLYLVSVVAWAPWGLSHSKPKRPEGHVTVLLRPLATETDYLLESLGKAYDKWIKEKRMR